MSHSRSATLLALTALALMSLGASWSRFRGPGGSGVSDATGLPTSWSSTENVLWKTELPGPGTSSPIVVDGRIYITSYSGYGLAPGEGDMKDLMRHLQCISLQNGKVLWKKDFKPILPESAYRGGNDARHGYASSTPVSDGKHLYVFFGKSGVYCLDLDGKEIWHTQVGERTSGWGSSNSPILYRNLVIVNASVESQSLMALDRTTGKEVWRTGDIRSSWTTPILVDVDGKQELVVSGTQKVLGFDPETGKELWHADVLQGYICPSPVAHQGIVYATNNSTAAVRAGGRGDVTQTHVLWRARAGSKVSSPIYHEGRLHLVNNGRVYCLDARTGEQIYQGQLTPSPGIIYSSPLLADGKLYLASQHEGTYVLAAGGEFRQLARNVFADDTTRTNASPIIADGRLLLRTDRCLYCLGSK